MFNSIVVASVSQLRIGTTLKSGKTVSADSNGKAPYILNVVAGKFPNRNILSGTVAEGDSLKLESGKTHRRVNPTDLLKIKIPIIEKERQNLIVKEIEPIQTYISELKKNVLSPQGIIDKVFAKHFGFLAVAVDDVLAGSHGLFRAK